MLLLSSPRNAENHVSLIETGLVEFEGDHLMQCKISLKI